VLMEFRQALSAGRSVTSMGEIRDTGYG
jgi:hypothetical protein